jgi:hypothetical protein
MFLFEMSSHLSVSRSVIHIIAVSDANIQCTCGRLRIFLRPTDLDGSWADRNEAPDQGRASTYLIPYLDPDLGPVSSCPPS